MSRRKRLARAFAIAALGLGLAAPVAQARPLDVKGQSWTSAAAITVAASHHASASSVNSLPPNLRASLEQRNYQQAQPATISVATQPSSHSVNWPAVGLATGLAILVIGAFGITAYRLRRPAPVA